MGSVTVVTPPTEYPVSLASAKAMLLVDHSADDALIGSLIAAATAEVQEQASRSLVTQTLRLALDGWPADGVIRLWRPPVQSVTSVQYYDGDGALQTVPNTDYVAVLDVSPPVIVPAPGKSWAGSLRAFSAVRVTYVAGYGDAATVATAAADLVGLLMGLVAVDYENRDSMSNQAMQQRDRLVAALQARYGWSV